MDAELFAASIQYEHLTQSVYRAILAQEVASADVQHDSDIEGRSGVKHQIDVHWRTKSAGIDQLILIECKNYSSPLTLQQVRNFFAVVHDIGNCVGVMVTKVGFQSGAAAFARHYGIHLKLLRKPTQQDWDGRVKSIQIDIIAKSVVSTLEKPVHVFMTLEYDDENQRTRLQKLEDEGRLGMPEPALVSFRDKVGEPIDEELRHLLPSMLNALDKEAGGPYRETIKLHNKHIVLLEGSPEQEVVRIGGLIVDFYVEEVDCTRIAIDGENIVTSILKDFDSGDVEFVQQDV